MKNVIVKKSRISGRGVFAAKDFKKGDIVLKWKPKTLKKPELKNCSDKDLHYISYVEKKIVLLSSPEKYVNHSCKPNTIAVKGCDIAIRNIKKGEEITIDYTKEGGKLIKNFRCKCRDKKCKKFI